MDPIPGIKFPSSKH